MDTSYIITLNEQLLYGVGFQLISTLVLCLILTLLLYKPVLNALNKRKERIENQIAEAENKFSQADSIKFEYELKLADIEKEKASILNDARNRAKENEAQIIAQAKQEAEAIKNRAILDIQREEEKAREQVRMQIIEVSSLLASKFISKNIDSSEQDKLIDEAIKDLGEVKWQN